MNPPAPQFRLGFLGVGPQKTATTWLHRVLEYHPSVCLPRGVKETYYFDRRFEEQPLSWYQWHFAEAQSEQICGEVGPSYFDDERVIGRVAQVAPACRIIVNMRNPVERAFSLFRHHYSKGRVPPDFWGATEVMPRILSSGEYHRHLPAWQQSFGEERVMILLQEEIEQRPEAALEELYRFLGVRAVPPPANVREREYGMRSPRYPWLGGVANRVADFLRDHRLYGVVEVVRRAGAERIFTGGEAKMPKLSDALYREIAARLEPEITYLEQVLGRRLPQWRVPRSERIKPS